MTFAPPTECSVPLAPPSTLLTMMAFLGYATATVTAFKSSCSHHANANDERPDRLHARLLPSQAQEEASGTNPEALRCVWRQLYRRRARRELGSLLLERLLIEGVSSETITAEIEQHA